MHDIRTHTYSGGLALPPCKPLFGENESSEFRIQNTADRTSTSTYLYTRVQETPFKDCAAVQACRRAGVSCVDSNPPNDGPVVWAVGVSKSVVTVLLSEWNCISRWKIRDNHALLRHSYRLGRSAIQHVQRRNFL